MYMYQHPFQQNTCTTQRFVPFLGSKTAFDLMNSLISFLLGILVVRLYMKGCLLTLLIDEKTILNHTQTSLKMKYKAWKRRQKS